jgi:serine phosphatase RsbU (regulator of sigma subunit)
LKKLYSNLINNGLNAELSFTEQKKVRLVNGISLFILTITGIFFVIMLFRKETLPGKPQLINLIVFGTVLLLNNKQKFLAGRIILCIYFPLFLSFPAIMVPNQNGGSELSILSISLMPIFLFDKKKISIPLFIYCMLIYTAVKVLQRMEVFMPFGDTHIISPLYYFQIVIAFAAAFIFTYMFKSEHLKYETVISEKSKELEEQKQEILSSITYAQRIQAAILPNEKTILDCIPHSFILFKPKDIVSGDFFWFSNIDKDSYIIVAADCTGHGVPGAIMTVIGSTLLHQIVIEHKITQPSEILIELDKRITVMLKQEKQNQTLIRDGMDLALLKVDKAKKEMTFVNAKRPSLFIRNGEIKEFHASKFTIDGLEGNDKVFDEVKVNFLEGDIIYLFTDGCIDQFGGKNNKKFMIKRFRELLLNNHSFPMPEQKILLSNVIESWTGNNEQTDDILIIGVKL